MQLKTVGESLDALESINKIVNTTADYGNKLSDLGNIGKKYTSDVLKMAIAEASLDKIQIRRILTESGLTGELLETTIAELTQTTATNTLAAAETTATASTGGFTLALKGLGVQLKALIVAHPVIAAIAAIGVTTFAVVKAVDYFNKSLECQKEKLSEAKSKYEEANSELETIREKIEELNNIEHPSLIEQEEIERAIVFNQNLETKHF